MAKSCDAKERWPRDVEASARYSRGLYELERLLSPDVGLQENKKARQGDSQCEPHNAG
jgi:hypothetical protein